MSKMTVEEMKQKFRSNGNESISADMIREAFLAIAEGVATDTSGLNYQPSSNKLIINTKGAGNYPDANVEPRGYYHKNSNIDKTYYTYRKKNKTPHFSETMIIEHNHKTGLYSEGVVINPQTMVGNRSQAAVIVNNAGYILTAHITADAKISIMLSNEIGNISKGFTETCKIGSGLKNGFLKIFKVGNKILIFALSSSDRRLLLFESSNDGADFSEGKEFAGVITDSELPIAQTPLHDNESSDYFNLVGDLDNDGWLHIMLSARPINGDKARVYLLKTQEGLDWYNMDNSEVFEAVEGFSKQTDIVRDSFLLKETGEDENNIRYIPLSLRAWQGAVLPLYESIDLDSLNAGGIPIMRHYFKNNIPLNLTGDNIYPFATTYLGMNNSGSVLAGAKLWAIKNGELVKYTIADNGSFNPDIVNITNDSLYDYTKPFLVRNGLSDKSVMATFRGSKHDIFIAQY